MAFTPAPPVRPVGGFKVCKSDFYVLKWQIRNVIRRLSPGSFSFFLSILRIPVHHTSGSSIYLVVLSRLNFKFIPSLRLDKQVHVDFCHTSGSSRLHTFILTIATMFENYSKCRIWIFQLLTFSSYFCHIKIDVHVFNTLWP